MAEWNQNVWGDARFAVPTVDILESGYIYGDFSPTTLPGIDNGTKTDAITGDGAGIQIGVTKFTDFTENFNQTAHVSQIDNLPIGALMWDDATNDAYDPAAAYQAVLDRYNSVVVGVEQISALPAEFSLAQNYPNPFNPSTIIEYSITNANEVQLAVYDIIGREIAVLVNENQSPGTYKVDFDAAQLSSGVYFYKLKAGNNVVTKKMILMK